MPSTLKFGTYLMKNMRVAMRERSFATFELERCEARDGRAQMCDADAPALLTVETLDVDGAYKLLEWFERDGKLAVMICDKPAFVLCGVEDSTSAVVHATVKREQVKTEAREAFEREARRLCTGCGHDAHEGECADCGCKIDARAFGYLCETKNVVAAPTRAESEGSDAS